MGIRGLFFISFFAIATCCAPFNPFWGIVAYFGHYYLWPERQWWGELLAQAGIRVSLSVALVTAGGMFLQWPRLRARLLPPEFHSQEVLMWLYVGLIAVAELWSIPINPEFEPPTIPLDKMYKLAIFAFMLTRIVCSWEELRRLLVFSFVVGGLYLGLEAYRMPSSAFADGRLEGIGGPDFQDSNFAATHFVLIGIVGAVLLITHPSLLVRGTCLFGGVFVVNAIIMTRSRGAFLSVAASGMAALILADRHIRKYILMLLPVAALGAYMLTDDLFWQRMDTIMVDETQVRDRSSSARLEIWKGSLQIFQDYPLGVGAGRFFSIIGNYRPEHAGRDTHSTYLRCLTELGIFGLLILLAMFVNAFLMLRWCQRVAQELPHGMELSYIAVGLQLVLVALSVAGLTISFSYSEELFVYLMLPVCCFRATCRLQADSVPLPQLHLAPADLAAYSVPVPHRSRPRRPPRGPRSVTG